MGEPIYYPKDCLDPDFENCQRVHDWKNYISDDLRFIWPTFTDEQKAAIADNADDIANGEEWE